MLTVHQVSQQGVNGYHGRQVIGTFDENYRCFTAARIGVWEADMIKRPMSYTMLRDLRDRVVDNIQKGIKTQGTLDVQQLALSVELGEIVEELMRKRHPSLPQEGLLQ